MPADEVNCMACLVLEESARQTNMVMERVFDDDSGATHRVCMAPWGTVVLLCDFEFDTHSLRTNSTFKVADRSRIVGRLIDDKIKKDND